MARSKLLCVFPVFYHEQNWIHWRASGQHWARRVEPQLI